MSEFNTFEFVVDERPEGGRKAALFCNKRPFPKPGTVFILSGLQGSGCDCSVALGQVHALGVEAPAQVPGPVPGHGGEVVQDDAQAQIGIDGGVVCIGFTDQGDGARLQQEAVGLAV